MPKPRKEYVLPDLTDIQWGYIAGFLDADGSIGHYQRPGGSIYGNITFTQVDRTPLESIMEWLGTGNIYHANKNNLSSFPSTKPIYNLQLRSLYAVRAILTKLIPLLIVKQGRAHTVLSKLPV